MMEKNVFKQLELGELINLLRGYRSDAVMKTGLGAPHSYRGFYNDLAFVPTPGLTVGESLTNAKSALNSDFLGYKGGHYFMDASTNVWFANRGKTGEPIGYHSLSILLDGSGWSDEEVRGLVEIIQENVESPDNDVRFTRVADKLNG